MAKCERCHKDSPFPLLYVREGDHYPVWTCWDCWDEMMEQAEAVQKGDEEVGAKR